MATAAVRNEEMLRRVHREKPIDKIAFFGHFGAGNLGNEATLYAILYHLRRFHPHADATCVCTYPETATMIHNVNAVPISPNLLESWIPMHRVMRVVRKLIVAVPSEVLRWKHALRTMKGKDLLIVPGTGLLTDAHGLMNWGPYNLFRWSVAARIRHCRLLFVSVGVGPIYSYLGRFFIKRSLSLADFRSYRDLESIKCLELSGIPATYDDVYPDLAFSLPNALFPESSGRRKERKIIGLGVLWYPGRYSVSRPSSAIYQNYLEELVTFVSWLLERPYDVRMLIGDMGDVSVIHELRALLAKRVPNYDHHRIIEGPCASMQDLLKQLAECDIVVATRFHNVLLALLSNKPAISISFHRKCSSLMSQMDLSEYCADINSLRASDLIAKLIDAEKNASELTVSVRERSEEFRRKLDVQYELVFA